MEDDSDIVIVDNQNHFIGLHHTGKPCLVVLQITPQRFGKPPKFAAIEDYNKESLSLILKLFYSAFYE